jgi:hypothetical protein
MIPEKLGRFEWHDVPELAVYTDRPRLIVRLWVVPGVRRWQVGDQEARGLFQPATLPAVAALIRAPACSGGDRGQRVSGLDDERRS